MQICCVFDDYLSSFAFFLDMTNIKSNLRCNVFGTGCPAISSRIIDRKPSAWYVIPFLTISRISDLVSDRV
jgi:hypothetical protein